MERILRDGENSKDLESPLAGQKEGRFVCVCVWGGESRLEDVQSHRGREGPGMGGGHRVAVRCWEWRKGRLSARRTFPVAECKGRTGPSGSFLENNEFLTFFKQED